MHYICILCGAGGASAHKDPHPPHDYNCHECPGEHTMWPDEKAKLFRTTMAAYKLSNERLHHKPMTVYLADGRPMKTQYNSEILSFTHNEMNIRNPWLSECGRFDVDPRQYGFSYSATGGANEALYRAEDSDGSYIMLTDSSGLALPEADDVKNTILGLYDRHGDPIATIRVGDIPFED